jgi:hypothetical protein
MDLIGIQDLGQQNLYQDNVFSCLVNMKTGHNLILDGYNIIGLKMYHISENAVNKTYNISNNSFKLEIEAITSLNDTTNYYLPINKFYRLPNNLFFNADENEEANIFY